MQKEKMQYLFFFFAVTYLMAKHHSKRTNESDLITRTEKPVTLDKDMWRDKKKDKEEERLCLEETLTVVDTRRLVFQARADEAFAENVTGLCTSRMWWSKKNLEVWA